MQLTAPRLSEVLLLWLIREYGTLEIWTNQERYPYYTGAVLIGHEGEEDPEAIQGFIVSGYLKLISVASNCKLYAVSEEGETFLKTFHLH